MLSGRVFVFVGFEFVFRERELVGLESGPSGCTAYLNCMDCMYLPEKHIGLETIKHRDIGLGKIDISLELWFKVAKMDRT